MAEAVAVLVLTILAIGAIRISPLREWEQSLTKRPFLEYGMMLAVPLAALKFSGRSLAEYGLRFDNLRYHLELALACCIPYASAHAVMFGIRLTGVAGALLNSALALAILFGVGWQLRRKPAFGNIAVAVIPIALLPLSAFTQSVNLSVVASSLIFYGIFLGPGEEILFRGFIESRLNQSFPGSWIFFGVRWGWGVIMSAFFFGLFHLLNLPALLAGRVAPLWGLGLSTACWGLFFSFIREKSGSILAPSLVHGIPQAIAMGFFAA